MKGAQTMIDTKQRRHFPVLLATLCVGLTSMACRNGLPGPGDPGDPNEEAPDIPPESTFLIPFDDFTEDNDGAKRIGVDPTTAQFGFENWGFSALNVGAWNAIITVGLAVPVAAFVASFEHEPELEDDGTFVWTYSFNVASIMHTAELHGRIEGNNVNWDMYITREGDYEEFNWFSGVSTLTETEGSWTLNKNPQDAVPFIEIEWHRDPDTGAYDITYTNVEPGAEANGGYIAFAVDPDADRDASYTIYNAEVGNMTEIQWRRADKSGRVRAEHHFDDNDWHCWDDELQNADCPE
jgi:hypothetical protein